MKTAEFLVSVFCLTVNLVGQPLPADVSPKALAVDEKERDTREKLPEIIEALSIKRGSLVADIGTGYGYYAVRLSPAVRESGRVYAVEIDRPLFERLGKRLARENLKNIQPVLGKPDDPGLPESRLDAVLLADVYHELESPATVLRKLRASLKPEVRLMIIEYLKSEMRTQTRDRQRQEHNIAPEFVEEDLKQAGFTVLKRHDPLGPGYDRVPTYYVLAAPTAKEGAI